MMGLIFPDHIPDWYREYYCAVSDPRSFNDLTEAEALLELANAPTSPECDS